MLDPAFSGSFLRKVVIDAFRDAPIHNSLSDEERVEGTVARVARPAPSLDAPAVHYDSLAIEDTLGLNLREPATVHISVERDEGQPLPLRAVELQMRQRSFCFRATAGATYTLRYGDASLPAPVYHSEDRGSRSLGKDMDSEEADARAGSDANALDDSDDDREGVVTHPAAKPLLAVLGRERENPAFVAGPQRTAARKTHPEMFWVGLLSVVTLVGAIASHRVRYEREGG